MCQSQLAATWASTKLAGKRQFNTGKEQPRDRKTILACEGAQLLTYAAAYVSVHHG